MLTTSKLRPQIFRHSLLIAAAITTLTGCDYFSDNWEIESGKCQALSSGQNEIAIVSEGSVGFLKMEKGCPDNLDILGSRFTEIEINGTPYKATLLCSDATGNRRVAMLGTSENSASTLSAQAMKEFTGLMGAKVTIEGESSRFHKGNFTKICQRFLPRQTHSAPSPSSDNSSLTLGDLLSGGQKNEPAPEPAPDPQAQMMAQAGYEKVDGEWRKKSRQPLAVTEQDHAATQRMREQGGRTVISLEKTPGSSYADAGGTVAGPSAAPVRVELTPEIYGKALERAKSTWLLSHPGTDLSEYVWEKSDRPDENVNGSRLRVIRFTTTSPVTGVISDVDVEVEDDGTPGYALSTDRAASSSSTPVAPEPHQATSWPINAFCTLDNRKNVSVFAAAGQDYHYTFPIQDRTGTHPT